MYFSDFIRKFTVLGEQDNNNQNECISQDNVKSIRKK